MPSEYVQYRVVNKHQLAVGHVTDSLEATLGLALKMNDKAPDSAPYTVQWRTVTYGDWQGTIDVKVGEPPADWRA